jgi:hypothetical protein
VALFARSYVEALVRERDLVTLDQLIAAESRLRSLPEELWLFRELLGWSGAARSGVYQYYEGAEPDRLTRARDGFMRHGLMELAAKYEYGRKTWKNADPCSGLDRWIADNDEKISSWLLSVLGDRWQALAD